MKNTIFGGGLLLTAVSVLGLAGLFLRQSSASEPRVQNRQTVVITNVNVVPMDEDRVLPNRDVTIANGVIREIVPAGNAGVPANAQRIDGTGKYLIPGLIDSYTHVDGVFTLIPFLANGVTTVRNTAGGYPRHLGIRDRIVRGDLIGPRVLSTGGDISSTPTAFDTMQSIDTAEQAERVVAEVKRLGFDGVMVYGRISADAHRGVVEAAKRVGLPVTGHQSINVKVPVLAQSGQRSVENLVGLVRLQNGEQGFPDDTAVTFADAYRAGGVYCIPTLTVHRVRGRFQLITPDERRFFPPLVRDPPAEDARMGPQTAYEYRGAPHLVSIFHSRGVKILAGTDSGYPGVHAGFSLHGRYGELQNLHGAGLSNYEVLRAATTDAAEFLGMSNRIGTIALGKTADLVLLDANPLDDLANADRIAGIVAAGRWMSQGDLVRMLDEQARSFESAPDRFLGMPPLPKEHWLFAGKYQLRNSSGVVFGEERLVLQETRNSGRVITSEASLDAYHSTKTLVKFTLGPQNRVNDVKLKREGPDGVSDLQMRRSHGEALISGARPYYGRIGLREPVDDRTLLGGPILSDDFPFDMMATFAVAAEMLSDLGEGQTTELSWKQLELNPGEFFRNATLGDMRWQVTRHDEISAKEQECPSCRGYQLQLPGRAGSGKHELKLIVDDKNHPVRVEIPTDETLVVFERIGQSPFS